MIVSVLGTAADGTHCYLIDNSTMLQCGRAITSLTESQMLAIDRILLSDTHEEHISGLLPLLNSRMQHSRQGMLTLFSQQDTLNDLQQQLASHPQYPHLAWFPVEVGDAVPLPDGMATALPAQNLLPSIGWLIEGPWRALAHNANGEPCPAFWHWAANVPSMTDIICSVELTAKGNEEILKPAAMVPLVDLLPPNAHVWFEHRDPADKQAIMEQLDQLLPPFVQIAEFKEKMQIDL